MASTAKRRWSAIIATATLALLLSGCSPESAWMTAPSDAPTPSAAPTPSPTPDPAPVIPVIAVGTIVATGTLVGDDRISGDVDVRVIGDGNFELRLLDFESTHDGEISLGWSPRVVEPETRCTSSIMTMSFGDPAQTPGHVFPVMKDFTHGDPSFLRTVLIKLYDPDAFEEGCYISVVASAILDWTLPDMRPGLLIEDSGKTGGANGEVTLIDGEPVTYTVARDDLLPEIAARFGVTADDLNYLNPTGSTSAPLLWTGDTINLSKDHR